MSAPLSLAAAVLVAGVSGIAAPPPAAALEKNSGRMPVPPGDEWIPAGSAWTVSYYNVCTGWVWNWSGLECGEQIGVGFRNDICPFDGLLHAILLYCPSESPAGYAYTGTVSIYEADAEYHPVSGGTLGTWPFLFDRGWNAISGGGIPLPDYFLVVAKIGEHVHPSTTAFFTTDHPAAGPAGPQAAGHCYANSRETHTFFYGTHDPATGHRQPLHDVVGAAELLWHYSGEVPIGVNCDEDVTPCTWGRIKALYR